MKLTCHFTPFDTWFFRESRPQGSIGSSELASVFPPPVRTLLGAVRTAIGDAWHARHGSDWRQFAQLTGLQALIGNADNLGSLRCSGPWLTRNGERLYPAPATLMVKEGVYFSLTLGEPVHCDLGNVRLPAFPAQVKGLSNLRGAKPAGQCWLTITGWQALLNGKTPNADQVVDAASLFHEEPRLGIGRDNQRHSVEQGLLYQTRHLRLAADVGVELELDGLPEDLFTQIDMPCDQVIRLGGEGRQASLAINRQQKHQDLLPGAPTGKGTAVLYTLTPMTCAPNQPAGIPENFRSVIHDDVQSWEGEISGMGLRILAVACGRPVREGGWDMANHKARPVESLLPAGSALFVEALDGNSASLQYLHNKSCGAGSALGRGQLLTGYPLT